MRVLPPVHLVYVKAFSTEILVSEELLVYFQYGISVLYVNKKLYHFCNYKRSHISWNTDAFGGDCFWFSVSECRKPFQFSVYVTVVALLLLIGRSSEPSNLFRSVVTLNWDIIGNCTILQQHYHVRLGRFMVRIRHCPSVVHPSTNDTSFTKSTAPK